ncbi:MAG: hypothetical protein HOE90_12255 [Bacteriovoracaceae bacterium]|jgi:hypothetical protein|nr:hypothetical protein [Bacteriovoracaceae bacterium]
MKKKIVFAVLIIGLIVAAVIYGLLNYSYSKGSRTGRLVKLSKKGMILKTHEGILDLGSGDLLTWQFSIRDGKLGDSLEKYSGQIVRLEYQELLYPLFFDTKYNVTGFSIVNTGTGVDNLCRLVHILRRKKSIVNQVRPLIDEFDPSLMPLVRECQRN